MNSKVALDKAGRIVLPKGLRDKLRLEAGDELLVEGGEENITLRPVRAAATLKKELGVWVYHGESRDDSIPDLIDSVRQKRLRELTE
jgi:AbrB family looped-hinge helix DNA binding protein